jgi:hypothetical protein
MQRCELMPLAASVEEVVSATAAATHKGNAANATFWWIGVTSIPYGAKSQDIRIE